MNMKQIKLDLTVDEANLIMEGLGNLPFVKVHELIGKIHEQASAQVTDINPRSEENVQDNIDMIANEK